MENDSGRHQMESDSGGIQTKSDSGELQMEPTVVGLRKERRGWASDGQPKWWVCDELQMENYVNEL